MEVRAAHSLLTTGSFCIFYIVWNMYIYSSYLIVLKNEKNKTKKKHPCQFIRHTSLKIMQSNTSSGM